MTRLLILRRPAVEEVISDIVATSNVGSINLLVDRFVLSILMLFT